MAYWLSRWSWPHGPYMAKIAKIVGQIYIVKMAIFDQFYHHRKEWSYRDFKDIFGNGMSWGTKWRGVEVARVQIPN